jgi:primosomal protein N' (replication factor Y)
VTSVARVLPDVRGIDKTFDYTIPDSVSDGVRVGSIVRVPLHGRRVAGWVVSLGLEAPASMALKPIASVTGWGPPAELVDLASWAAWRWAGHPAALLRAASPPGVVKTLPPATALPSSPAPVDSRVADAFSEGRSVLRIPPAGDTFDVVLAAVQHGNALIVTPSVGHARWLAARLRRGGVDVARLEWARGAAGATVVGARAAAWAPVGGLGAVVVLDEHDEALKEERTPAWHARDVAVERARRSGVPCVLVSPSPTLEALGLGAVRLPSRVEERAGWPVLEVVDRRGDDPARPTLLTDPLVRYLRSERRVVCVINVGGRARLMACAACGELAWCERCGAAVAQDDDDHLQCRRCGTSRPVVCLQCGASRMKVIRPGVARLRDEIEAMAGTTVVSVTGKTAGDVLPDARIYVGTEAVLHQVPSADVVAFLDVDQELLAPRYRAAEQAMALMVRAARLLGERSLGGRLLVQTRVPHHEVLDAVLHADPGRLVDREHARREALGFPPSRALAEVSGAAAPLFIEGLPAAVEVVGPSDGRWLVRAPDHQTLSDALGSIPRPPGRLRVDVDPLRV